MGAGGDEGVRGFNFNADFELVREKVERSANEMGGQTPNPPKNSNPVTLNK